MNLRTKPFFTDNKGIIAIAHRGGAAAYGEFRYQKENTMEVFKNAVKLGYKYLELDTVISSDGVVIVLHVTIDKFVTLLKLRDEPNAYSVQKLTFAQIKQKFKRQVPTISEVFKELPKTKFLIDAKTDEVAEPLTKEISRNKAGTRVHINSFDSKRVIRMQKLLGPEVSSGLIISRYPSFLNSNLMELDKGKFTKYNFSAVAMPYIFLNQKRVDMIHKQGMRVLTWSPNSLAWSPNSKENISRAIDLKVDGIISDNVELLSKVLASRVNNLSIH